jgi:hypothetical protein
LEISVECEYPHEVLASAGMMDAEVERTFSRDRIEKVPVVQAQIVLTEWVGPKGEQLRRRCARRRPVLGPVRQEARALQMR